MRTLLFLILVVLALGDSTSSPDPAALPAPPSVALNPAPLSPSAPVTFMVNTIPASAKYVIYAQMNLVGLKLKQGHTDELAENLSKQMEQLTALARLRGANLVVLLSSEHGVPVYVNHGKITLVLRSVDPVVTAILFQWIGTTAIDSFDNPIRFETSAPPDKTENFHYTISLKQAPVGATLSYWTYGNIARFVQDAKAHDFNTIAMGSTQDAAFEEVWLPGCDEALKVSLKKPELDVTIYKRKEPSHPRNRRRARFTEKLR